MIKTSSIFTEKGTPIRRSRLGVGKDMGGSIYLHKMYADALPDQGGLKKAQDSIGDFSYNVIKASKDGAYTFFDSVDFDYSDEPTGGDYVRVSPEGAIKHGYSNKIWHHKWLWVKDDYTGFDVEASKARSAAWLKVPGVDFCRIGDKDFFDAQVVSRIPQA